MKKEFAVNPDLTSMPLTSLDKISQEWIAVGIVASDFHADGASNK